mgnify:FL=1
MDIKIKVENEKAYVYTPFNKNFAKKMRAMNGTWNGSAWVVNTMFVSAVREIMRNVYGYDDTDTDIQTVTLRIVFLENQSAYHDGIRMFGKTIATAYSRDSGAKLGADVALIKGSICSGGSVKNWNTEIDRDTVINLYNVQVIMYEKEKDSYNPEEIKIEVVEDEETGGADTDRLREEKERLLKRIAEIDELLSDK